MSEEYDYHYMTMWIEPYSHVISTTNDRQPNKYTKSESIIDTYISSQPDHIYDEWKMIWN